MKSLHLTIGMLPLLIALGCTSRVPSNVLPENETVSPVQVLEFPTFTEGIVFDADGDAYVSEILRGVITKIESDSDTSIWVTLQAPNGHKILDDGTHLVCDGELNSVVRLSPDGEVLGNAAWEFDGKALAGPNDVVINRKDKSFYFTDPEGSSSDNRVGSVYHVDSTGAISLVSDTLAYPNGIALDHGGKRLFVTEFALNRILEFPILDSGGFGPGMVFADLPSHSDRDRLVGPDGIHYDEVGFLYVAHVGIGRIQVFDQKGVLIRSYEAGMEVPTNVIRVDSDDASGLYVTGAVTLPHLESRGALVYLDLSVSM
jgi:gluconolactonase